ncbi:RagB/SusD family nutrient uptake outer membrane protein [Bacteroides thetaiotaomicron]|uniref:RagB/SusD family nutrient uptake outer membrane protein n=1 Tax=Bacteroides thetaiotaomicron TaxID=818 RepID=UPI00216510A8|nr:RagB/SusD family nutrient uptake outer membrane protein [Bacteroides thetaiotaomicron]MCS2829309.1 RagB/SusD family nutrient uptake outer membrane protein [Bacteroides thetaiotaomicron]
MNHVDECLEIDSETRRIMKAEARFLRAYYYFELFRQYGPVYIWGDIESDELIKPETIDRHTVDENVNFIAEEYDKASCRTSCRDQRFHKMGRTYHHGSGNGCQARLMLYAASPLYNGCDLYKGQMKNLYGDFLFHKVPILKMGKSR